MKLKEKVLVIFLVFSLFLNVMAVTKHMKYEIFHKSMTYRDYGITIYYKGNAMHRLDMKENRLVMSINGIAEIISENDALFYKKDDLIINLTETGQKAFAVDEQGALIV